jgi:Universal stress protein family
MHGCQIGTQRPTLECQTGPSVSHWPWRASDRWVQVGLLVVGSRGMGSFKRSLMSIIGLGSVSDYVVHNAPAPVLVYKAPVPAAAEGPAAESGRAPAPADDQHRD